MEFVRPDGVDSIPKATLEILNKSQDQNVIFKIKTTLKESIVVTPGLGIIAPGHTFSVEIKLKKNLKPSIYKVKNKQYMHQFGILSAKRVG